MTTGVTATRRLALSIGILAAVLCVGVSSAHAADYYVSTSGNNSNPGTQAQPWRTVAYAVSNSSPVTAGDTIYVRGGVYAEYIVIGKSGSNNGPITLRPYQTEQVALTTGGQLGNIMASGKCNWTIQGFEIRDSSGGGGIYWDGSNCSGTVSILNNVIHNTDSGDNASCVFLQRNLGTFIVENNVLYDCDGTNPGNNTGIVVFGHINSGNPGSINLQIRNNEIYNEGVGIKIKHPFATDQNVAVDISYNLIRNVYHKGGISVAGGKFTSTKVHRIHHNVILNSSSSPGIEVGDDFDEWGVEIDHNTVYGTQTSFTLCLADNCSNGGSRSINLHDNIFVPVARSGTAGYAIWTEVTSSPFTAADYNCFWNQGSSTEVANWGGYGGGSADTFAEWQSRGFDLHSVRGNPMFVNAAGGDFRLQSGSPCKNLRGNGRDAGAYETGSEVIGPRAGTTPRAPTAPSNFRVLGTDGL